MTYIPLILYTLYNIMSSPPANFVNSEEKRKPPGDKPERLP